MTRRVRDTPPASTALSLYFRCVKDKGGDRYRHNTEGRCEEDSRVSNEPNGLFATGEVIVDVDAATGFLAGNCPEWGFCGEPFT